MTALPKLTADSPYGLSPAEENDFRRLEKILELEVPRWNSSREKVRETLLTIHGKGYYKPAWGTFENYLEQRWLIKRSRGYQLLDMERAIKAIKAGAPATIPLPNERQARELKALPDETKVAVWKDAVKESGGKPVLGDVKAAIARVYDPDGVIPDGVEVFIEGPEEEEQSEAEVPAEQTDEEFLKSLPLSGILPDATCEKFQQEALAFRACTEARLHYSRVCKPLTNKAKKAAHGHIGPWMSRHFHYLRINDPSRWKACGDCGGNGTMPLIGQCAACRGHGYHVG